MRRALVRPKLKQEVTQMTATGFQTAAIKSYPARRMAVIRTIGDPDEVGNHAIGNLYGVVYALHRAREHDGRDFDVGPVCALWPDAHLAPRHEWLGVWGLEVPDDVESLPHGDSDQPVELETWPGGEYAEMIHRGPMRSVLTTIERLRRFVDEQEYVIEGAQEEEYLTRPGADEPAIRIRYRVRPR